MLRRLGLLLALSAFVVAPAGAQAATVAVGENASCAITAGALNC